MLRLGFLIAALVVALSPTQSTAAAEPTPEQRLASQLARAASVVIAGQRLTVPAIETASILIDEATTLDPDNPELWRFAMALAILAERQEDYARALGHVLRLDPADDVARLQRLNLDLERLNTVEDRIARYRQLLAPEVRGELGDAVASRLALDLAKLLQRHGDVEGFSEALADAVATDPSNREAAAVAAGFFRINMNDPCGEAELLMNLMLSDPTDIMTQVALAELLLEHGAYAGADRLYDLATRNRRALGTPASDGVVADQAIAQWANGRPTAALATIRQRQREFNELVQAQQWADNPDLNPVQRAHFQAILPPTLATVRAAILARQGDEASAVELEAAVAAYDARIEQEQEKDEPDEAIIAELRLEAAWIALWLGGDLERVQTSLAGAETFQALSETARRRFDGWLALRRGELGTAIELLEPLAGQDAAADLGLARAYAQLGRRQDAARAWLSAARSQPGTLIGTWAASELASLFNRRLSLSDEAARLEALIAPIRPSFDRYPENPSLAVTVRIRPIKPTFGPFDPIIINLEITNQSPYPLAIDRAGPIRPEVVLRFSSTLATSATGGGLAPIVVDLGRRLRLTPRQQLVVPIDLRRYPCGRPLASQALSGTFIRIKAVLNPIFTAEGALKPALLGGEDWIDPIRIEGVRVGTAWLREAIETVGDDQAPDRLVTLALLVQVLARYGSQDAGLLQATMLSDARAATAAAFADLDGPSQAWLLGIIPRGRLSRQIGNMALSSEDRLVQMNYLMYHLSGEDDPMLIAAQRPTAHPHVRYLAESYVEVFKRLNEAAERGGAPPRGGEPAPPR